MSLGKLHLERNQKFDTPFRNWEISTKPGIFSGVQVLLSMGQAEFKIMFLP